MQRRGSFLLGDARPSSLAMGENVFSLRAGPAEASITFPTPALLQRASLIFCLRAADWFSIWRSPNSEPLQTLEINNDGTPVNPQPGVTLRHQREI